MRPEDRKRVLARIKGRVMFTKADYVPPISELRAAMEKRLAETQDPKVVETIEKTLPVLDHIAAFPKPDLILGTDEEFLAWRGELRELEAKGFQDDEEGEPHE